VLVVLVRRSRARQRGGTGAVNRSEWSVSQGHLPVASPVPPTTAPPRVTRRREPVPAIRPAEPEDLVRLADIEVQSDQVPSRSGLGALPIPAMRDAAPTASVVLVAGRPPVAFVRVDEVDAMAHLDQLSVLPSMTRRGIGTALVQAAIAWAAARGYRAMTLSTFVDAPWNASMYAANGFEPMKELTPGLAELRDWERAIGLDAMGARMVMRRRL
jgi:GNAT superfamily N-acetyltransferase